MEQMEFKMSDLDRLLSIQRTRDYYDDGDIDKEEYESLKAKLEEDLEKAVKWDNTTKKGWIQITQELYDKLEQEIKQLKEENVRLSFTRQCSSKLREDNLNLKQKLEKIKEFSNFMEKSALMEGGNNPYLNNFEDLKEILESK